MRLSYFFLVISTVLFSSLCLTLCFNFFLQYLVMDPFCFFFVSTNIKTFGTDGGGKEGVTIVIDSPS